MNTIYLISQSTFQNYEDIPVNIKLERLNVFIKKAQDLDLKPFLGHALYYDFIQNFNSDGTIMDTAPQPYKDLLNGSEYLDKYGHIVLYKGCCQRWCILPSPGLSRQMRCTTPLPARL